MKLIAALSAGICCAIYAGWMPDGMVYLANAPSFPISVAASVICMISFAYILART
jgi:hypothetical protein